MPRRGHVVVREVCRREGAPVTNALKAHAVGAEPEAEIDDFGQLVEVGCLDHGIELERADPPFAPEPGDEREVAHQPIERSTAPQMLVGCRSSRIDRDPDALDQTLELEIAPGSPVEQLPVGLNFQQQVRELATVETLEDMPKMIAANGAPLPVILIRRASRRSGSTTFSARSLSSSCFALSATMSWRRQEGQERLHDRWSAPLGPDRIRRLF